MTQTIDWRSPDFAKSFARYDRADFAQEFLRRNPDYREDYADAASETEETGMKARLAHLADHWGLVFRLRP